MLHHIRHTTCVQNHTLLQHTCYLLCIIGENMPSEAIANSWLATNYTLQEPFTQPWEQNPNTAGLSPSYHMWYAA